MTWNSANLTAQAIPALLQLFWEHSATFAWRIGTEWSSLPRPAYCTYCKPLTVSKLTAICPTRIKAFNAQTLGGDDDAVVELSTRRKLHWIGRITWVIFIALLSLQLRKTRMMRLKINLTIYLLSLHVFCTNSTPIFSTPLLRMKWRRDKLLLNAKITTLRKSFTILAIILSISLVISGLFSPIAQWIMMAF